jgi:hypothetical protein
MNRRDSLKTFVLGTIGSGLAIAGCKPVTAEDTADITTASENFYGRTPEEAKRDAALHAEQCLNEHELATVTTLANLIMPPSEHGGIIEAEVPEFIEFMMKDYPKFERPMRGGLAWIDHESNSRFDKEFRVLAEAQQKEILDEIAFYDPDQPSEERPMAVNWFSLLRGLTMTGYWTSRVGIKDLGYTGNAANVWDGVPQHVLDKHGVAYDPAWIAKCVDQSKRDVVAEWDEQGNLLT